jgi:hypothetical protein
MNDQTVFERHQKAAFAVVGDEVIFLHEDEGAYFSLDGVGAFIWHSLETPRTFGELVLMVMNEYDVEEPQLREDLTSLFTSLVDMDLLASS